MAFTADTQLLARLRVVGAVILCAGLSVFVYGLQLKSRVPEVSSEDFLHGRVSIDDIGRRNDAEFSAVSTMAAGGFIAFLGLAFVLGSSRRMMRLNAMSLEYSAEAVGRGLRRGLAEDEAPAPDLESRLAKLQELHAKGLVSDDEYASKRREILASL